MRGAWLPPPIYNPASVEFRPSRLREERRARPAHRGCPGMGPDGPDVLLLFLRHLRSASPDRAPDHSLLGSSGRRYRAAGRRSDREQHEPRLAGLANRLPGSMRPLSSREEKGNREHPYHLEDPGHHGAGRSLANRRRDAGRLCSPRPPGDALRDPLFNEPGRSSWSGLPARVFTPSSKVAPRALALPFLPFYSLLPPSFEYALSFSLRPGVFRRQRRPHKASTGPVVPGRISLVGVCLVRVEGRTVCSARFVRLISSTTTLREY